ncbi:protein SMG5-like [Anneissia japonica]|uniref:protein SMG5-like n=1 Tax=Anneissia japonica TaxID=1529436 RepID=UPI001425B049|nr:protein SMG5-like [Anneissia japonica]
MEEKEKRNVSKPDIEKLQQTKRICRGAQDIIKKLSNITKIKQAHRAVFDRDTIELRMRLKDLSERLMFLQPETFGRKAEEFLWWKVYYDVINVIKKNRKHVRRGSSLESAYRTHLISAIGFYHHLLLRLQKEFNLNLKGIVDLIDISEMISEKDKTEATEKPSDKAKQWAEKACHRCLIYLGDLARYHQDFDGYRSQVLAQRYYHQALLYNPDIGMPHNQLGTLAGMRHQSVDATYHYIRCMLADIPFEGASDNLAKIFQRNRKKFRDLPETNNRDLPPDIQRPKDIKHMLIKFLRLQDLLQPESNPTSQELSGLCQAVLHDFNLCMYYPPNPKSNLAPVILKNLDDIREQHVSADVVFKVVMMALMTIYKLQKAGSKHVSAAIAFTLALFSHLLNHVNMRIQNGLYDVQHPSSPGACDSNIQMSDETDEDDEEETVKSGPTSPSNTLTPSQSQDADSSGAVSPSKKLSKESKKQASKSLRRRRAHYLNQDKSSSEQYDLSEGELSISSQSDFSTSDGELHSEGAPFSSGSDSDFLMDSQEFEISKSKENRNQSPDTKSALQISVEQMPAGARGSPATIAQNLKDLSSQLFSQNPNTSFLKRNIRLAPSFEAYENDISVVEGKGEALDVKDDGDPKERMSENEDKGDTIQKLISVLANEELLPIVKLFCDWLRGHSDIITTTAQSSHTLWARLALLLNQLPREKQLCEPDTCRQPVEAIINEANQNVQWHQELPITEDIMVWKIPPLRDVQKWMKFDLCHQLCLSNHEEVLIRVVCLRQFGHSLSKVRGFTFTYDSENMVFLAPSQGDGEEVGQIKTDSLDRIQAQKKMVSDEYVLLRAYFCFPSLIQWWNPYTVESPNSKCPENRISR